MQARRCFRCGEAGHLKAECANRPRTANKSTQTARLNGQPEASKRQMAEPKEARAAKAMRDRSHRSPSEPAKKNAGGALPKTKPAKDAPLLLPYEDLGENTVVE